MIVLAEKGIKYESKLLSFSEKQHKSAEVVALNPRGQLPTLKLGDIVVNESVAACQIVEEKFRNEGNPLMPSDLKEKAVVLQRIGEIVSNYSKFSNDLYPFFTGAELSQEEKEKKITSVKTELQFWEGYVKDGYVAGKNFSLADAVFYPTVGFLDRMGVEFEANFPNLAAYNKTVSSRASVQASWPPHWKEGEGKKPLKGLF
jgi:glutathione S-transferase